MDLTQIVVLGTVIFLLVYEVFALVTGRTLISRVVWIAMKAHPVLLFLSGFLAGHWFWPPEACFPVLELIGF